MTCYSTITSTALFFLWYLEFDRSVIIDHEIHKGEEEEVQCMRGFQFVTK
jgi:hypothetical protein